jgi:hypothetical protein
MVNFTVQDAFNKAKAGVKLPLLQPSIKAQSVSPGRKLAHNEYYKNIKEKVQNRQAQIEIEQVRV